MAETAKRDHAPRRPQGFETLITALGGGTLDFTAMLSIADVLPVMIAYVDRDFRYAFVNRLLADWFAMPRQAILGQTMKDVLGDGPFDQRLPMLEAALGGERVFFASEFDHPARGSVAVQTDYVPWADAAGHVNGIIILVTDITEQRAAERALRESEQRFRRIANSAPVMMWVTRLDRVRDFVNDHYVAFVAGPDGTREEVRTLDWQSRIHPDDVDRIVKGSIAGEASLKPFTLEGRYSRYDGEYRWLRSVSQPRFGSDGELSGFIGAATDITVAKEAELELRREVDERTRALASSEARFRSVFDTVLEVLVLMEVDGTVIEMNRKTSAWRAPNLHEAIGRKIWDSPTLALYPQHVPTLKKGVRTAAKGRLFNTQVRLEREGMPVTYLDISVQPVPDNDSDAIRYLLFEARDVTDLELAQEQLRQSQKMEALGQLTGGIAHDFNNLLTVVVGGLDIIVKAAEDPKIKRYAGNALSAAERGARLTAQLLAFSRVQRLEVRPTYVAPLIENMRPLLRNVLGPGIEKRFELDEAMIPVMADPTQLELAVLNLAINARDAMPDGGVLTFALAHRRIVNDPDLQDGDYIELCIGDTGEGMPPDVVARAFEPFFTTKEVGKGTGLGLSMVYGMARQSGGGARIESTPGQGTRVKMLFRKADQQASETESGGDSVSADEAPPRPMSILVVDDDPDVRGFIVATLEEQGYDVREASDGREGLRLFKQARSDLVILDFVMPGLSGADLARLILDEQPEQPILFVSGYSETDAVKRAAPGAPLLAKPFRADALAKAVRSTVPAAA